MGYNTEFKGELKFTQELTASQLAKVKSFLGEDCRNHPEWGASSLYHIGLELLDDFSGLRWNGAEKTYSMDGMINLIITHMRTDVPDFGFVGKMVAQGEDIDDRYEILIKDGWAVKREIELTGTKIECPHCKQYFYL